MRKAGEQQFETIDLGDVSMWAERPRRYATVTVPPVPEGHTRLWRSTAQGGAMQGHWADQPLPGYGNSLYHMDLPHAEAERHLIKKGKPWSGGGSSGVSPSIYIVPREGRHHPMPGKAQHALYSYYEP